MKSFNENVNHRVGVGEWERGNQNRTTGGNEQQTNRGRTAVTVNRGSGVELWERESVMESSRGTQSNVGVRGEIRIVT